MITRWIFCLILIFQLDLTCSSTSNKKTPSMSFPRRRQLDETFRRSTRQCEQKESCQKYLSMSSGPTDTSSQQHLKELADIELINCVRRCISSSCYQEIYEKDPLERGEIDVRATQFKSCWVKDQKD